MITRTSVQKNLSWVYNFSQTPFSGLFYLQWNVSTRNSPSHYLCVLFYQTSYFTVLPINNYQWFGLHSLKDHKKTRFRIRIRRVSFLPFPVERSATVNIQPHSTIYHTEQKEKCRDPGNATKTGRFHWNSVFQFVFHTWAVSQLISILQPQNKWKSLRIRPICELITIFPAWISWQTSWYCGNVLSTQFVNVGHLFYGVALFFLSAHLWKEMGNLFSEILVLYGNIITTVKLFNDLCVFCPSWIKMFRMKILTLSCSISKSRFLPN